jgi:hypothetical protein
LKWHLEKSKTASDDAWKRKLYEEGHISKLPTSLQERQPTLFPDLIWVWQAFCLLDGQRATGPNGPIPISLSDMAAYLELDGRSDDPESRRQILRFIPPLDRFALRDFYDRQAAEMKKIAKTGTKRHR